MLAIRVSEHSCIANCFPQLLKALPFWFAQEERRNFSARFAQSEMCESFPRHCGVASSREQIRLNSFEEERSNLGQLESSPDVNQDIEFPLACNEYGSCVRMPKLCIELFNSNGYVWMRRARSDGLNNLLSIIVWAIKDRVQKALLVLSEKIRAICKHAAFRQEIIKRMPNREVVNRAAPATVDMQKRRNRLWNELFRELFCVSTLHFCVHAISFFVDTKSHPYSPQKQVNCTKQYFVHENNFSAEEYLELGRRFREDGSAAIGFTWESHRGGAR